MPGSAKKRDNNAPVHGVKGEPSVPFSMKSALFGASVVVLGLALPASAQDKPSGHITVAGWNIAAEALQHIVPAFEKQFPDVKVDVLNEGHADLHDRALAQCAAGGVDLPDVVLVENSEAELYWARFPDCFADVSPLGFDKIAGQYPEFKKTELTYNGTTYAVPWDSGPVAMFYRRDIYQQAGVDPASIKTYDDFIAAGKKVLQATGGKVHMATIEKGGDDEWFRQMALQEGCSYYSEDGSQVTVNQPGCVKALGKIKDMWDAGILNIGGWDQKIQFIKANAIATVQYGGWYEGTIRSSAPDQSGKWGVYLAPALEAGGNRASNSGGSSLAISNTSQNKAAAWAFVNYALGTPEGQIEMMKYRGLPVSLEAATKDPFISAPQPYWGNQAVWTDILGTLDKVHPSRATQYYSDSRAIMKVIVNDYLDGKYPDAKAALDAAAQQMASTSGLPVKG